MAPTRIPGIEYAAMPKAGTKAAALAWPPRLIVIHATDNTASRDAEARYASTRTDPQSGWTSAHAYVDTGGALGSLPLSLQAWAAYSYANQHGIHIEMCGRSGAVPAATIARTAALVRTLLALGAAAAVKLSPADVAAGKSGICGHRDITIGLGVGDHEDPGASFDWAGFMAQVNGGDDVLADERAWVNNADKYGWAAAAMLDPVPGVSQADGKTGTVPNAQAQLLRRAEAKLDAVLKALGVAQADLDELQARPAFDVAAFAAALAPLLADHLGVEVSADQLVAALESDAGQAALVKAANAAEDS